MSVYPRLLNRKPNCIPHKTHRFSSARKANYAQASLGTNNNWNKIKKATLLRQPFQEYLTKDYFDNSIRRTVTPELDSILTK